jgi:hypothetical protein
MMADAFCTEVGVDQPGFQVGKTVEGHRSVVVLQDDWTGAVLYAGAQVDPGVLDQTGVDPQSAR